MPSRWEKGHPYAWRTRLRGRLPWFLIELGVARKGYDCQAVGARHHWYNIDDQWSGCYHCEVIREQNEERTTYFGLYSRNQRARVIELLASLGVRSKFLAVQASEERLRAWTAWDESSATTHEGFELWICSLDLDKLGTKLVELYPERKFGAE